MIFLRVTLLRNHVGISSYERDAGLTAATALKFKILQTLLTLRQNLPRRVTLDLQIAARATLQLFINISVLAYQCDIINHHPRSLRNTRNGSTDEITIQRNRASANRERKRKDAQSLPSRVYLENNRIRVFLNLTFINHIFRVVPLRADSHDYTEIKK